MSGKRTVNTTENIQPEFIKMEPKGDLDQETLKSNSGVFPADYKPTGILSMAWASEDGKTESGKVLVRVGEFTDSNLAKEALAEFYTKLPKSMELARKCLDGTFTDRTPGVYHSDRARTNLDGTTYDMGDGSGQFLIEAPSE